MLKAGFIMPHPPIIVKEIGRERTKQAQATINGSLAIAEEVYKKQPEVVVVITPHGCVFKDAVCIDMQSPLKGDFGDFGSPKTKITFDNDRQLAEKIANAIEKKGIYCMKNYGDLNKGLDHGAMVPLYFIQQKIQKVKIIHITVGMMDAYTMFRCGKLIKEVMNETNQEWIALASGDLSHCLTKDAPGGYHEQGEKYDEFVMNAMANQKMMEFVHCSEQLREMAGECGHRPISMLLGCLDGENIHSHIFSYEGPFGVGYANVMFDVIEKNKDLYIQLAKTAIETYVEEGQVIDVPKYVEQEMMDEKRGVFVSLKKKGKLRGCIGTIAPTRENVAEEIIENAIKSASEDPRFSPVAQSELDELDVSVDILMPTEEVDGMEELNPYQYGVIVSKGNRRGLLLPNIEGIESAQQQVAIALQKAGISPNEKFDMKRFEVVRHK